MSTVAPTLNQGVTLHRAGRLDEAEAAYRQVLARDPRNHDAFNLLGLIAQTRGSKDQALEWFDKAIAAKPSFPDPHYNRANMLKELGRTEDALASYRRAIQLRPDYADARLNLGVLLHHQKDLTGAIAAFREMGQRCPTDARGHYNLGRCLLDAKDHAAAETALNDALKLNPRYVDALITLAKLQADANQTQHAITTIKQALDVEPENAKAWTNLGTYLSQTDNHTGALEAYDKAIASDPSYANARVNRGLANLVLGKLGQGWDDYAERAKSENEGDFRRLSLPYPVWSGEPLAGKRIFIWGEQGLGDEILYSSMIPEIAAEAEGCMFGCAPRLAPLFRRSFPNVDVRPFDEAKTAAKAMPFDYHSSVLDLGRWRRRTFSSFPNRTAYLRADPAVSRQLRQRYLAGRKDNPLLVGYSWRSFAPHTGEQKTTPLDFWKPLFAMKKAVIINLQYGAAETLKADLDYFARHFNSEIITDPQINPGGDLDHQASQIAALDIVVTISNTTAHIAAALGVPTWVIVPSGKGRLWYWFKEGLKSPWYQNVSLVRWPGQDLPSMADFALEQPADQYTLVNK